MDRVSVECVSIKKWNKHNWLSLVPDGHHSAKNEVHVYDELHDARPGLFYRGLYFQVAYYSQTPENRKKVIVPNEF